MILKIVSGINLFPAIGEVRVLAIFLRSAARKMLGHTSHAVRAESLTLEAPDIGSHQTRGERCVFTEGAVGPRPARLGSQIGHRVEGDPDTHRQILLPGDIT